MNMEGILNILFLVFIVVLVQAKSEKMAKEILKWAGALLLIRLLDGFRDWPQEVSAQIIVWLYWGYGLFAVAYFIDYIYRSRFKKQNAQD